MTSPQRPRRPGGNSRCEEKYPVKKPGIFFPLCRRFTQLSVGFPEGINRPDGEILLLNLLLRLLQGANLRISA